MSGLDSSKVIWDINGDPFFDEDIALAQLLTEGVLFSNGRRYVESAGEVMPETVVLFVLCNDVFAWGCADAECLPHGQIENLYRLCLQYGCADGMIRWCCIQRNEQPQKPIADLLRSDGAWDSVMEALPANHYDKMVAERYPTNPI